MTQPLTVTIPADPTLRREIEQGVEEYADVMQAKSFSPDAETVLLVLNIASAGVTIAGGVAGILTFIRSTQQKKREQGHHITITIGVKDGAQVAVEQADVEVLARLLQEPV